MNNDIKSQSRQASKLHAFFQSYRNLFVALGVFAIVGVSFAATIIGSNISTDGNVTVGGTLGVTGATTFSGASPLVFEGATAIIINRPLPLRIPR